MAIVRSEGCRKKLDRLNKALRHQEGDRIPLSDFYWSSFLARWRQELGLPEGADIYRHYDLDWICITPNMDPHIRRFEILRETEEDVVLKTGFEATIRKKLGTQMPYFVGFDTDSLEKMAAFRFDDPRDPRRYFSGGDDQLNGVGDVITRDLPPWIDRVKSYHADFAVYGSVCEAHEYLWRIIGSETVLVWILLHAEELGRFIERVGEFVVGLTKAQIEAADGLLDGMIVWGDVAYRNGMLFSPELWRQHFKPIVAEQIRICHDAGLPAIYHGCGNASAIFEDFIEIGLDAYNPLEAKADLDVIALRRRFGHKMGFCGNIDALAWANDSLPDLEAQVMRKLNAAKGGGYLIQSDHSVPSNVSAERYEFVLNLLRTRGTYPLQLGSWDIPELSRQDR